MKKFAVIIGLFLSVLSFPAQAGNDPIYTSWKNDTAVGGFDVVSFYSGKPLRGKKGFKQFYRDAEWRFSSRANLDLFRTNPEAFIPQYGGYCAWAAANGKLAKGSPKHWHLRDGKLYLNFNSRIQTLWDKDIPGFIKKADANWPQLLD